MQVRHNKPALKGEVDASVTSRRRGCIVAALVYVNPSVKPSVCQLPVKGSLLVRFRSLHIKPALKGEVDASATSRRRGYIVASVVFVNPSANPPCGVLPAPRPGGLFGALYKLLHSLGGPPMTAPTLHIINLWQKHGDAQRHHIFTISHARPPQGGFHMAEPYFTLRRQYFTAGVSPLISFPLQPRWLRRGSR